MYKIEFKPSVKKDLKHVQISDIAFIHDSLNEFIRNFSNSYEILLMQKGIIKKLKGEGDNIYRLKLRRYRVIYKKYEDILVILVLRVSTREGAYKK